MSHLVKKIGKSSGNAAILVFRLTNNEQQNMGLDALRRDSFEDDAGKTPDFLELLIGH